MDTITYQGYETLANTHILPYFETKHYKLRDITATILQAFFDEKAMNGRTDGKGGLSPASLRKLHNIVNQTLTQAIKGGLLPTNPCQFVTLPKEEPYQSQFYTATQLQALFNAIAGDPLAPLVHIAAMYGLRRSELLGLQWDSIDFENGFLTIRHTVAKVTKVVTKDKTKNASSHRSFPLVPEAIAIFQEAKRSEAENHRLFGKAYTENPYVFKWPNGQPFSPDYVSKHFRLLLKKHGLPLIRFHELRHSCASLLLNNGCTLKDVQEWMGHADIKMTANIYGHLDAAHKQGMANQLSSSLWGKC